MKRLFLVVFLLLTIFLLFCLFIFLNIFIIGRVKEVSTIGIRDLYVTNEKVSFSMIFSTSADTMSKYSYRIENNIMYIKIRSVLVGIIGISDNVEIEGDFIDIEIIILEDNDGKKIIWDKNDQDKYLNKDGFNIIVY